VFHAKARATSNGASESLIRGDSSNHPQQISIEFDTELPNRGDLRRTPASKVPTSE
jgi:hypothetical protein